MTGGPSTAHILPQLTAALGSSVVGARWHQLQCWFVATREATLRHTIQAFEAELLDAVICGWMAPGGNPEDLAASIRGHWQIEVRHEVAL